MRLSCGHSLKTDKRPNPRKIWPDPQQCDKCKNKQRVVEIQTIGLPSRDTSYGKTLGKLEKYPAKKTVKKTTKKKTTKKKKE